MKAKSYTPAKPNRSVWFLLMLCIVSICLVSVTMCVDTAQTQASQSATQETGQSGTPAQVGGDEKSPGQGMQVNSTMLQNMATQLREQGLDVSAIETAIQNNDLETAQTLLQQLMQENNVGPQQDGKNETRRDPPSGSAPSGTPPSGTPPSGTPPSGTS